MKVSDYIIDFLIEHNIDCVFGYPGGAITHIMDSIYGNKKINFISSYHEQASAFAAEGYARVKNNIGVAVATSGPGATNLITGIGSAFFDSIPCVYITGQVNTYEYKEDLALRQKGFQETDIVAIVSPITKYATRITDPRKIKYELGKAFHIAMEGRKGPVLLDIPMDIQRANIEVADLASFNVSEKNKVDVSQENVLKVIELLNNSKRPVILVGGGVRLSSAVKLLGEFVRITKIPVVSSLMGLDSCVDLLDAYCGFIGVYGNRHSNYILANSDLIISLGSRLDSRQTGTNRKSFARDAKLVRVDIDCREFDNKVKQDEITIEADVSSFIDELLGQRNKFDFGLTNEWLTRIAEYKDKYAPKYKEKVMDPNAVMHKISEYLKEGDVVCLDVGQNQMWAAQSFLLKAKQRMLIAGGMAAMGFSLPAAVGAYYASDKKNKIIAFVGDGGFQMNIQELQLLKKHNIPIKIIIFNNDSLGMIRHFQEMYFDSRYIATVDIDANPDFCAIAKAYGIESISIDKYEDLLKIDKCLQDDKPKLINIMLDQTTYVYPKLSLNRPIEDQDPLIDREELKQLMIVKPLDEY